MSCDGFNCHDSSCKCHWEFCHGFAWVRNASGNYRVTIEHETPGMAENQTRMLQKIPHLSQNDSKVWMFCCQASYMSFLHVLTLLVALDVLNSLNILNMTSNEIKRGLKQPPNVVKLCKGPSSTLPMASPQCHLPSSRTESDTDMNAS